LSPLDWHSHAIDEGGYHPIGVLIAECGHRLMIVTSLHDQPNGRPCEACAGQQFAHALKDDSDQQPADLHAPDGLQVRASDT